MLVADDHAPTRDDVGRALAGDGRFTVCAEAADAAEAIAAALRTRPHLCLLDIRMPGSGLSAAWEIKSRLPTTKIVMLTVSAGDADLFMALRAGADSYLLKDIDLRRLPDALKDVSEGRSAIPRQLVALMVERFHGRDPRRRSIEAGELAEGGRRLTSREWQVLDVLADGRSTAEIARELLLSQSAVRAHISAIVRKLGLAGRTEVIESYRRHLSGPGA